MPLDDVSGLKSLGSSGQTAYKFSGPDKLILEVFPFDGRNGEPGAQQTVEYRSEEFTSLCPKTGQPDFATITIAYVPRDRCVETKSLKLYLFAWRNEGAFMESIVKKMADDLQAALGAYELHVTGEFAARGGVTITTTATRQSA